MDYPALLAVLQQHANPERAVPMQAYMKHRFAYFGIGKPELARLCRPFFKTPPNSRSIGILCAAAGMIRTANCNTPRLNT